MNYFNWIFNIVGILLIFFIIWWFWLAKSFAAKKTQITNTDLIDIIVANGVYEPALIKVRTRQKFKLRFLRKDPSPCAEWVVFQKLNISDQLPVGKPHVLELKIDTPGEYDFTCQMNMYRGKLIVE